jgi:hypothetical protein
MTLALAGVPLSAKAAMAVSASLRAIAATSFLSVKANAGTDAVIDS